MGKLAYCYGSFRVVGNSIADSEVEPGKCNLSLIYCADHIVCGYVKYIMILKQPEKVI